AADPRAVAIAMSSAHEGRRSRARAVLRTWLASIAVGALLGTQYLAAAPPATTWTAKVFVVTALVSTTTLISIVPAIIVLLAALVISRPAVLGWIQALV